MMDINTARTKANLLIMLLISIVLIIIAIQSNPSTTIDDKAVKEFADKTNVAMVEKASDGSLINEFYLGPVLPIISNGTDPWTDVKREITIDFSPYGLKDTLALKKEFVSDGVYIKDSFLQHTALVTDRYDFDGAGMEENLYYPFISSYEQLFWGQPRVTVNGEMIKCDLIAGLNTNHCKTWFDYLNLDYKASEGSSALPSDDIPITIFSFPGISDDDLYIRFFSDSLDLEDDVLTRNVYSCFENKDEGELWYHINKTTEILINNKVPEDVQYEIAHISGATDQPMISLLKRSYTPDITSCQLESYLRKVISEELPGLQREKGLILSVTPEQFMHSLVNDGLNIFSGQIDWLIGSTFSSRRVFFLSIPVESFSNEEKNSISIDMLKKGSYDMYAVNPFETYDILTTCKNSITPSTQYIRIKGHDNVGVFSQNLEYGKSNKEEVIPINESIKHYYMEVISSEEIE